MNKWEEKRTRPVLPIYLAALVWPVGALLLPTYRLSSVLIIAGASAVVYGLGSKFCPTRVIKKQVPYATGSEDVDAMLTEITAKLDELHGTERCKSPGCPKTFSIPENGIRKWEKGPGGSS